LFPKYDWKLNFGWIYFYATAFYDVFTPFIFWVGFFFLSQDTGRVLECHFNFPRYIITAAAYSARRFPLGPFLTRFTYVNPRFDYESNWKEFLFYEQLYEWDLILLKSSFFALSIFFII
jgi:hypothetical protein